MKFTKKILVESLKKQSTGEKTFTDGKKQNVIISEDQLDRVLKVIEEQWQEIKLDEDAKPDFLDLDGDGNKKESMKKAAKDKKEMKEDSEGEETYNYGENEGEDEKHIKALEKDMAYDEDHEDRHEKGTRFESEKEKEKLIQEDIKKMKQIIKPISKI